MLLACDQIHIWQASLVEVCPSAIEGYRRLLSEDEILKAARILFPESRTRFIVGRMILRELLAGYAGIPPEKIRFAYNRHGKPYLQGKGPYFNLSHSGNTALYAVSRTAEVGVDIECIRKDFDWEAMSLDLLSPRERSRLKSLPAASQHETFLLYWVQKEALLKAVGKGLSALREQRTVQTPDASPTEEESPSWSIRPLKLGDGLVGALAADREGMVLQRFHWTARKRQIQKGWRH